MAGRTPKSVEQKIREGRPGHHPPRVPVLVGGRITIDDLPTMKPPRGMSPGARRVWRELIKPLAAGGMLDRADLPIVELASDIEHIRRRAVDLLDAEGILGENSQGRVAHPAISIMKAATTELRLLYGVLGVGPASRVRIGAEATAGSLRTPHEGGMAGELGRTLPPPARLRVVGDDADPD